MGFTDWGKSNKSALLDSTLEDQRAATARLHRLNTEAAHLGSKSQTTASQLERAQEDLRSIQASIEDFKNEIQRIESRIDVLKDERRREHERLDEVKRKIRSTEAVMIGLDNNDLKWDLNNRLLNLKERASMLYENTLKNKSRVASLRMDQDHIKSKIFSAKQSLARQERSIQSLEDDALTIQEKLDSIESRKEEAIAEHQPLTKRKQRGSGFTTWRFSSD